MANENETNPETVAPFGNVTINASGINESGINASVFNNTNLFGDDDTSIPNLNSGGSANSSRSSLSPRNPNRAANENDLTVAQLLSSCLILLQKQAQPNPPSSPTPQQYVFGQPLCVTGHELKSGLEINASACSALEQSKSSVLSKHNRGSTEEYRLKRRRAVCVALDDELCCNNVLSLLTQDDISNHDIASDCQKWQSAIRGFTKRCETNDMITPFLIPARFSENDPSSVRGPFISLLTHFSTIEEEAALSWQRFFNKYAAPVELESATWAWDILEKSMTAELKTLVNDDFELVDAEAKGAITVFKIMTNHMVLRNQETVDTLNDWLRNFDIRQINGQNVSVAAGKCRAIIRALDGFGLPSNVLRCLLDGFARVDNESFKSLCVTLSTMNRSALMQQSLSHLTQKQKCFEVLKDLETTYIALSTQHKWLATGHSGSAFIGDIQEDETHARAMAARQRLPFDEWVKTIECKNCGVKGHIAKDCPDKKKKWSGKPTTDSRRNDRRGNDSRGNDRRGNDRPSNDRRGQRDKQRFKKAYKIALESLAADDSSTESDDASLEANVAATGIESDSDASESDTSFAAHAARMYSSLKE